jgi:transcriptional regulator with XRE-family HTH domain
MQTNNENGYDPYRIIFGQRLQYLLDLKGLTQTDLAEYLGYTTPSLISQICGGSKSMSMTNAMKTAEYLNVPLNLLTSPKEIPNKILKAHVALSHLSENHYLVEGLIDVYEKELKK